MRSTRLLSLLVVCLLAWGWTPARAQDAGCDPTKVIADANAIKATGDKDKDVALLATLSEQIESMKRDCTNADVGTRLNPVPFGQSILASVNDKYFELTITKVVRGSEALTMLKTAGVPDDPPAGQEYLVATVKVKYTKGPEDEAYQISYFDFYTYSKGRLDKSMQFIMPPNPKLDLEIFPSFEGDGWIARLVPSDDPDVLLGVGTIYFATR